MGMEDETLRPATPHARTRGHREDAGRGVGFERIGDVAARVLRKLQAKVVANDNRRREE